jgi:2-dehydro-3-deoxy-D-arabinonate dehydratase
MKLYRTTNGAVVLNNNLCYILLKTNWNDLINDDDLYQSLQTLITDHRPVGSADWLNGQTILAPIDRQEIWAAGVTYLRSKTARMEEAAGAGGGSFYDKVYDAERPEIFFKANAQRTVGAGGTVRIRRDSTWNVPEPELTLFVTSNQKIVGYTIGNDMSSRNIEGENPLYLPQAKTYDGCAALGPCLYVPAEPLSNDTNISIKINRENEVVFTGSIAISQMKRGHHELVGYLFRECSFPNGCFLMTGTGIVPPNDFTLQISDEIIITVEAIGTLWNIVGL